MSSRIGDLAATSTVVSTDLFEKEQTAFAASEKITAAALKTALLGQIFTAGDQIKLGASPDAAGAVTIDASSFTTTALSIKNGATTATITLASGATLTIGPALAVSGSAPTLQLNTTTTTGVRALYKAAESGTDKWGIGLDGSHQFIITNAALNTANLTITDAGAVTTRAGVTITTGGLTVTAGGATITAGGLTVTAGGIALNGGGLVLAAATTGISTAGTPAGSGVSHAVMFSDATAGSSCGIASAGTGNYSMYFRIVGTGNTGQFLFNVGTSGVTPLLTVTSTGLTFRGTSDVFVLTTTLTSYNGANTMGLGAAGPNGLSSTNPNKWVRITDSSGTYYFPLWL